MKTIFFIILIGSFGQLCSQDSLVIDKWVKTVDSLYNKHLLSTREYPGRTFVGSLNGYYYNDTLVYINTLTDGEDSGIETKYYVKDSVIFKVMRMAAQFDKPNTWTRYYNKHKINQNCDICHTERKCDKTIIIYSKEISIVSSVNGRPVSITPKIRLEELHNIKTTFKSLRTLLDSI